MNSYQRLKQENNELRDKVKELEVLNHKDYYIRKVAERIPSLALVQTECKYFIFILMSPNDSFAECRIDKNLHINTAKINGVNLFEPTTPTVTQVTDKIII